MKIKHIIRVSFNNWRNSRLNRIAPRGDLRVIFAFRSFFRGHHELQFQPVVIRESRVTCSIFKLYCDHSILMCHPTSPISSLKKSNHSSMNYYVQGKGGNVPRRKFQSLDMERKRMNSFDDAQEKQKTKKVDRLFRNLVCFLPFHSGSPSPKQGVVQLTCMTFGDSVWTQAFGRTQWVTKS